MKKGDVVRYSRPADHTEGRFLFVIADGPFEGRVHIRCLNSGLDFIQPVEVVAADEVELIPADQFSRPLPA